MIEVAMYIGIGLLTGCLVAVIIAPLVHERAVRLTVRRLEATLPHSITEVEADKDLLRAEFAMSARRMEMTIERLRGKTASQLVELGKKTDAINRLRIQRDSLKTELMSATTKAVELRRQIAEPRRSAGSKPDTRSRLRRWMPYSA
jgi:hypothetical protein